MASLVIAQNLPAINLLRFMLKHMDGELQMVLEKLVPPIDLEAISAFRQALQLWNKQAGVVANFTS